MTTTKQDRALASAQAAATDQEALLPVEERAKETPAGIHAELKGETFRLSENTGIMALMEWAAAGDGEGDSAYASNLRAMFHVLQDIIDPEDFARFKAHARKAKVGYAELIEFQNRAFEALSGNPTGQPGA